MGISNQDSDEKVQADIDKLTQKLLDYQNGTDAKSKRTKLLAERQKLLAELAKAKFDSEHQIIGGIFKGAPIVGKKLLDYADKMALGEEPKPVHAKSKKKKDE